MSDTKKILVVDDDPDCLDQTAAMLQATGHELILASSQAEAEELLLRHQPSLAVLDLMMEEMDSGFVLCHTIKKLYPDMPVILLTGVTAATGMSFKSPDPRVSRWVEADVMLDKPVRPESLRSTVAKLLKE
ncbi:MAG TPA: response regulator [Candidatus Krumholzibacteria bacterium]|nr:response regulator [Candidatus Krumholzibacteria bacterium]HPD73368.1 response regulator [Candidatus Krumholzibacteria bacterium]HRY42111.1 response regulator [Candidatus Krumholzibacteria bacterium]